MEFLVLNLTKKFDKFSGMCEYGSDFKFALTYDKPNLTRSSLHLSQWPRAHRTPIQALSPRQLNYETRSHIRVTQL
jgi:hypothetical protein